jgi:CheY-like chemotaxis protein
LPKPRLPVAVTVGGVPATIMYAGGAADSVAGSFQVNFRVPANAPVGDAVPLVLTVGGTRTPDGVTMAVRSQVQRVLVWDAIDSDRNRLTRILKSGGYEVFAARDGSEALAVAGQHPLDMVICSLQAPEAERLEAIRAISTERRQLKVVATAGALDSDALRAADLLGAQAVLTKPLAAEALLRRVREILRTRAVGYLAPERRIER